jgi:prepilin-type N-terminal cleavage/methylation domain-containing protein
MSDERRDVFDQHSRGGLAVSLARRAGVCGALERAPQAGPLNGRRLLPSALCPLPSAFTLVELMIAVALMLLLMVGINLVFRMTGEAVGAGQALSEKTRDAQAAQAVMYRDFSNAVVQNSPCIILHSRTQPAFRNRADELADSDLATPTSGVDPRLTIDIDGNNEEGEAAVSGEIISAATYNIRNHRTDTFSFFVRDLFRRQTGNEGTYIADQSVNEAWLWYGHLVLPNNQAGAPVAQQYFYDPTSKLRPRTPGSWLDAPTEPYPNSTSHTSNPNNYYATQWILGRVVILLREKFDHDGAPGTPETIPDNTRSSTFASGIPQAFIWRTEPSPGPTDLTPLQYNSNPWEPPMAPPAPPVMPPAVGASLPNALWESRYDLACTSIASFRTRLEAVIAGTRGPPEFAWWQSLFATNERRFFANPFVMRPVDSEQVARQAPIFLPSCTQFIVEYAGDFVKQNRDPRDMTADTAPATAGIYGDVQDVYFVLGTGAPNPDGTDGEIDFHITWADDGDGVLELGELPTAKKQIRWYGMPRDTNSVTGSGPDGAIPGGQRFNNQMPDVVPLRDIVRTKFDGSAMTVQRAPCERLGYGETPTPRVFPTLGMRANYAAPGSVGMQSGEYYTCAFGPDDRKPAMIRITMVLDDPNARLADGQTFEFVFKLQ